MPPAPTTASSSQDPRRVPSGNHIGNRGDYFSDRGIPINGRTLSGCGWYLMRLWTIWLLSALLAAPVARDARAQEVWAGAALQYGTHRFEEAPESDRLEGAAPGVVVVAGARVWRHIAARVEWAQGGRIEDVGAFTVDIGGRTVTITSSFTHRARAVSALGGFTHVLSSRARLAYLLGAAFTRVERTFETDAPLMILGPSAPNPTTRSTQEDRFVALAGGADAIVRLRNPLHAIAGVRVQELRLDPEITGRSLSWFTGVAWVF